jgi:hypothetical protein
VPACPKFLYRPNAFPCIFFLVTNSATGNGFIRPCGGIDEEIAYSATPLTIVGCDR